MKRVCIKQPVATVSAQVQIENRCFLKTKKNKNTVTNLNFFITRHYTKYYIV